MRIIVIALCFIVAVAAEKVTKSSSPAPRIGGGGNGAGNGSRNGGANGGEHGGGNDGIAAAGCANPPKDIKMSDCCTNFPKFFSKEVMAKNCSQTCDEAEGKKMCCMTDCVMNAFGVLTDGKFDGTKSKSSIAAMNANNPAWTKTIIEGVVDGCVDNASAKLTELRSKAPPGMGPNCTEATSLNMVIGQCIRRELFFQCPGLSKTPSCKALFDFGKGCAFFPFHDGPPGSQNGNNGTDTGTSRRGHRDHSKKSTTEKGTASKGKTPKGTTPKGKTPKATETPKATATPKGTTKKV